MVTEPDSAGEKEKIWGYLSFQNNYDSELSFPYILQYELINSRKKSLRVER